MIVSLFAEWQERLSTIALMYARILPIFLLLPILNSGVISSTVIRNSIIFVVIIGLWPMLETTLPTTLAGLKPIDFAALAIKEAIVGASIGFALALPFWIFSAFGAFIDVGRGASMGSLIDPTNGQESTEAANLINFCVCVVFLEFGGMRYVLEALARSYQTIGLMQEFTININVLLLYLGEMMKEGFILASPILLMLLLTECLLGLFSRFTPQLNAFSVSLTIKSVIAFFILSMYFWQVLPEKLSTFMGDYSNFHLLDGGVSNVR